MSKLIVGNLKMSLNLREIALYINEINENLMTQNDIVICPSYIYIPYFTDKKYNIGTQDVSMYEKGSYTGEVSAYQLKSMGIKYAIVGHSERRKYFNETDEIIHKKISQCLENRITPIICIGESKEEKLLMKTEQVIRRSILDLLQGFNREELENVIIAYEPLWAIGSGITPTSVEIEETSRFIKDLVKSAFKIDITVLYGGSIRLSNISKFTNLKITDGFLIGGASTIADEFIKIIEEIN